MKRILVAMTLMGAALVVAAGVDWAATVNCQVGVPCEGTDDPDELIGTNQPDEMNAFADNDLLRGRGADDLMAGDDPDADLGNTITDGDDELIGSDGRDFMVGFGGSDVYRGGSRGDGVDADEESVNPGEDTVSTSGGPDFIDAIDGELDTISCGRGEDTVFFDVGLDEVANNCEEQNPPDGDLTAEAAQLQEELASLPGRQ